MGSDLIFTLEQLVLRDFRIRYRNMSLGILWSLLNPLIMVGVYTFVFSNIFRNYTIPHYPLYVLCGLICYNYFCMAWIQGTYAVTSNATLVKRVKVPQILLPLASVIANGLHFGMQFFLVLIFAVSSGIGVSLSWLWLPLIILLLMLSVSGLAMIFSAFDVYFRDTRYLVESAALVLFWITPVFYSDTMVPERLRTIYLLNPIASLCISVRQVILDRRAPDFEPMIFAAGGATILFLLGYMVFDTLRPRFSDHL